MIRSGPNHKGKKRTF